MQLATNQVSFLQPIADAVNQYLQVHNRATGKQPPVEQNKEILFRLRHGLAKLVPGKQFTPYWITSQSTQPFIMAIYPDQQELITHSKTFLECLDKGDRKAFLKEWNGFTKWVIEIDTRLLTPDHPICVDNGEQFVALCCHEVGHATMENPLSLIENFIYQQRLMGKVETMMLSTNAFVRKFALPMFVYTIPFRVVLHQGADSIKEEIAADHFVPEEYRGELLNYMEQHILNNAEARHLVMTKEDFDNEQQVAIRFSRETIRMIKTRRKVLKSTLKAQYDQGDSKYMTELVETIGIKGMGYNPKIDTTNAVYEDSSLRCYEMDMETCEKQVKSLLEAATVTPRDITILSIQGDDVRTVDQKLFVVHTCYDFLEILQAQKDKALKKTPDAKNLPQDIQIQQINDILEKVMKKNVSGVGDRYGLFIKYPEGYEG